ncbi:hypothetical protein OGAPHI_001525 [Ogataea philodendri]|uniref:HCP-like protein n=1 Tax=Ogataea philodendri TaxID=1378263 RepID=A0A9P8PDR1_9ASCO|nr:uncharacterized protein OGAPHI_001525 [Ogataea philodendri]KAH3669404.1 hypothetical protein OGAPHI_001525 [Ogataea philodendri]
MSSDQPTNVTKARITMSTHGPSFSAAHVQPASNQKPKDPKIYLPTSFIAEQTLESFSHSTDLGNWCPSQAKTQSPTTPNDKEVLEPPTSHTSQSYKLLNGSSDTKLCKLFASSQEAKTPNTPSIPGTPLGTKKPDDMEICSDKSIPSNLSLTPKLETFSQNHILSPVINLSAATDSHEYIQQTLGPTSVSLVSTDKVLELYGRNAKKIKDPDVQFSYAQVLVRNALATKPNGSLEMKARKRFLSDAHDLLKRSSRGGCVDAQYFLGDSYAVGMFGKPDDSKALEFFEASGKARHAEGAYRTAVCYRKGWGCTPDSRKVVKFLEIAALNNHPVAMMEYGIYCFKGLMGLPDDTITKKQGISWLKRATEVASEFSCGAPYELGLIFFNGFKDIVIQDTKYAIKLFFQAASLGHAKSSSLLGKLYEVGDIVEPNADLSIHFYNMAASSGDPEGMMGLCSWYFVGSKNLERDYDEAFAWALRAAGCGLTKAMLLLQRFYELGIGCEKNLEKAKCWREAATKG